MTTITVRHVPDEVRNELAARAARSGQSLQEFVLGELVRLAAKPAVPDLMLEVARRKRATGRMVERDQLLADLDADRR